MNRNIKFIAWHKKLKRLINVYIVSWENHAGEEYTKTCKGYYGDNIQLEFSLDEVHLMEFTGLVDSTGTEIYEGHIIADDDGKIREVKWHSMNAQFYLSNDKRYKEFGQCGQSQSDGPVMCDTIEIIGNIYETPDLLISKP